MRRLRCTIDACLSHAHSVHAVTCCEHMFTVPEKGDLKRGPCSVPYLACPAFNWRASPPRVHDGRPPLPCSDVHIGVCEQKHYSGEEERWENKVVRAPDQGPESSCCCQIAGQGLEGKICFSPRHRYLQFKVIHYRLTYGKLCFPYRLPLGGQKKCSP